MCSVQATETRLLTLISKYQGVELQCNLPGARLILRLVCCLMTMSRKLSAKLKQSSILWSWVGRGEKSDRKRRKELYRGQSSLLQFSSFIIVFV